MRRVRESRRAQVGMAGSGRAVGGDGGCRERWWRKVVVGGVSGEVEVEVKVFAWLDV